MAKPPKSPPHSDIDGVRQDARDNVDAANASGQGTEALEKAPANSPGKPVPTRDEGGRDDRSR